MKSAKGERSEDLRKQIGHRIRELRQSRHISQSALADALELDRSAVCKWENGATMPSIDNMRRLADYFQVTVEAISVGPKNRVECGKAFVDAFLKTYGNTPLSGFLGNEKEGGDTDAGDRGE